MTPPAGNALRQRCLEAVAEEGRRVRVLVEDVEAGRTDAHWGTPVPWVPAWTVRDLVGHLGAVHRWATAIVRAGSTRQPAAPPRPPEDGLADWYAAGLADLVTALRDTPADAAAWHMSPTAEKTAASWVRRQAHELTVHRMDLEVAAGVPVSGVDPALAEDGVDEVLRVVVPRWAHTEPLRTATATVAVRSVDSGRAWLVRVTDGGVEVRNADAPADARLEGPADALLRRLWGRPAEVVLTGDPAAESLLRGR
ncbi:maleylpyruvate isomerase family mycothiol-dependent enzyme [Geodermatophilus sabuli]|uniref:Maleylpyruvate isomerase family mycothiol-dependent enzyme n=1 Tax=Geodermatophilus sabuli TaxID=1564158 RepID=A0A7K3W074_9ACTN|nr:maleylpyruvate isomerase family mycothiol-dependent enzyme [Geodermatophilus sabuli]NEK58262.1 maleylpyruvate isomerase family mycothiol-dependent enzyme [Geodermatophilus sabuli]